MYCYILNNLWQKQRTKPGGVITTIRWKYRYRMMQPKLWSHYLLEYTWDFVSLCAHMISLDIKFIFHICHVRNYYHFFSMFQQMNSYYNFHVEMKSYFNVIFKLQASYLSKAGLRVCVLERRHVIGGAAVTEEIIPGSHVSFLCVCFLQKLYLFISKAQNIPNVNNELGWGKKLFRLLTQF